MEGLKGVKDLLVHKDLIMKISLKRRFLFHTPQPRIPKTSEIQVEGHPILVFSNVLLNLPSSSNFYKGHESASFDSEKNKYMIRLNI